VAPRLQASRQMKSVSEIPRVARTGFRIQTPERVAVAMGGKTPVETFGFRLVKAAELTAAHIGMCKRLAAATAM
jgi:hypothetical protein